jgi:hypothetical protein
VGRGALGAVAVEVLAHVTRRVAGRIEPRGYRRALAPVVSKLLPASRGKRTGQRAVVVGLLAAQEGRPRRAARGRRHECVLKADTLVDETVLDPVHPGQRMWVLVVDKDEEYVGPGRGLGFPQRGAAYQANRKAQKN